MKASRAILLIGACCFLIACTAQAQSVPVSIGGLDISLSTNNPAPGELVTVKVQSYTADINSSKIVWAVNGKNVGQGIGVTSLTIEAPALGKQTTVRVTATTPTGVVLSDFTTITSGSVDLILESSGYVPPFFQGKIAPAYQNTVTVVAVPHLAGSSGTEYDPKSLTYQWKKNASVLQDQSGYGRQSIMMAGSLIPRPYTLTVTATTRDGNAQGEGYITISPQSPSLSFYPTDALYGPFFNRTAGSNVRIGSEKEAGVLAVPYGFDKPAVGLGGLSLSWLINGIEHPELGASQSVALRAPEGQEGSSDVSLSIRNASQILQGADASFSVSFTGTPNQSGSAQNGN